MTTYEILTQAQNLIRDPQNWTQGSWARDDEGDDVDPQSSTATCWCSLGAVHKTTNTPDKAFSLLELVVDDVADYNDDHTHAEVMAMFDKARELAAR